MSERGAPEAAAGVQHPGDQATAKLAQSGAQPSRPRSATDGVERPASRASRATLDRKPASLFDRVGSLVQAIRDNDEAKVEEAILRLSRWRRVFAPLAFAVGAFVMLFVGLRLLVTNWRLTLVQILAAMWIRLAMIDLKVHTLHGKAFNVVRGPVLMPIGLVIVAITIASFFLNAVFAFAVTQPGRPELRPAATQARKHLRPIIVSGVLVGVLLALTTTVITRWGRPWFTLLLGILVGVMMVSYVAIPARLIGVKLNQSRRDKLATTAVSGALCAVVCTPPYLLGRLGILMLGSRVLLIFTLGILLLAVGVTLHAGAIGSVRAIKMSATLTTVRRPSDQPAGTS